MRSGVGNGALYVYCFARSGSVRRIAAAGIDGGSQVRLLELGGVAAVVSRVWAAEFTAPARKRAPAAEAHLADPAWVIPRACRHERVIEEVMGCSPVLPLRFGTLFSSRRALKTFLADRRDEIAGFLDGVADKEEWAVKGFVNLGKAKGSLLTTDPVLRERCRRLPQSPGARYLQEKQLHAEVTAQAKRWCRTVAEQVKAELNSLAPNVCPVGHPSTSVSGKDALMVFHCAFLVARSGVERFRACVERIGSAYAEQGLSLQLSGPWPPHNFCPSFGDPPA